MRTKRFTREADGKRVVTITISMPRRLLRQVNRLRQLYSYPTMSEYVRERLQADLRINPAMPGALVGRHPETAAPISRSPA